MPYMFLGEWLGIMEPNNVQKGNKQRELQRKDNSNNRQIILGEQGFFVKR